MSARITEWGEKAYSCKMGKEKRTTYRTKIAKRGNYGANRGEKFSGQRVFSGADVMVPGDRKLVLKDSFHFAWRNWHVFRGDQKATIRRPVTRHAAYPPMH